MTPGRALVVCALLIASMVLAGCGGSSVTPGVAVSANAAVQGQLTGAPGASTGSDSSEQSSSDDNPVVPATDDGPGGGSQVLTLSGKTNHHGGSGGVHAATGGASVDCTGFHNQTGITDSTVTLANIADISGPVPGIFTSAQQATKAYVAYFNATSSLCGRKLKVLSLDSRTDAGGDQVGYVKACDDAFAAVGSMSAFDSGGAQTAQKCGLPDIRAAAVSDARNACSTCFGVQATDLHAFQNAVPDYLVKHYPTGSKHAAMVYVNAAASVENAQVMEAVGTRRGMSFVYSTPFDVAEFNYTPYVQRMKDRDVGVVQFVGSSDEAVRLARAMQSANYKPDAFVLDPTAYDPNFVRGGGSAVEGALVFIDFTPFEESAHNAELRLYQQWLQQVSPGAVPSYFGLFAWSATRLFVEQAASLGGRLTRGSLVARMRGVHGWTDNGAHAPQDVGGKVNSNCWRFLQLRNGHWTAVGGTDYTFRGSSKAG
ncbi:MAG TPA: ABC transporter substrate-binding protein [Marmoricola sp.]|nr:ABC transporter substrate-binding protein [Marmoricola sp.]